MNDVYVTIVGTALTTPEMRTTANTKTSVATLRVANHPRHFDQKTNEWVDGPGMRIKVNCWRRLAEHVTASIKKGDPVIIYGRETTRDWVTAEGESRTNFEVDAVTVGHDLSRGSAVFTKAAPASAGLVVEDAESDSRVNGELTHGIGEIGLGDDEFGAASTEAEAMAMLRGVVLDDEDEDEAEDDEPTSASAGSADGRGRRRRQPVPA